MSLRRANKPQHPDERYARLAAKKPALALAFFWVLHQAPGGSRAVGGTSARRLTEPAMVAPMLLQLPTLRAAALGAWPAPWVAAWRIRWPNRLLRLGCLWLIGLLLPLAVWAADDFLPPEQAFKVSARLLAADRAEVLVRIASGYYSQVRN